MDLSTQVMLELISGLRGLGIVIALLVLLFLNIVVKLLCHRVVEGESLVSSENVADKTEAKGEVRTETLESV